MPQTDRSAETKRLLSSVSTLMLLYVVDGKMTRKDTQLHSKYKIRGIKEENTPQKEAKEIHLCTPTYK